MQKNTKSMLKVSLTLLRLLNKLLRPHRSITESIDRRLAVMVMRSSLVYATFALVTGVVYVMDRGDLLFTHTVDVPVLAAIGLALVSFGLSFTQWVRQAAWLLVANHMAICSFALFTSGPDYWIVGLYFPVGLLFSGLIQRTKETAVVFTFSGAVQVAFMALHPEYLPYSFYLATNYFCCGGLILIVQETGRRHLAGRYYEKNLALQIIDATMDLIFLCDLDGNILRKNRAYQAKEETGRDREFFETLDRLSRETADSPQHRTQIVKVKKQDQTFGFYHVSCQPVFSSRMELQYVLTIARDITKIKEAEFSVQQQQEKALSSARLAELGEFAGSIAHEINNPLQVILASAQTMQRNAREGASDPFKVEKNSTRIETTVKKIVRIVNGLRTFVRDGSKDPVADVEVVDIIEQVIDVSRQSIEMRQIDVDLSVEPGLKVECREVQFCQVLMNLVSNAIHAVSQLDERWIRITARASGEDVVLSVIDSGNGIDAEVADKIMAPFFTTKPAGEGTGLGLSISSTIIKTHDGSMEVSTVGGHTAFVIRVPRYHRAEPAAKAS